MSRFASAYTTSFFNWGFFVYGVDTMETERNEVEDLSIIWGDLANHQWELTPKGKATLGNFLRYLEPYEIYEAMIIASEKFPENTQDIITQRFRYFCGICWNRIKGGNRDMVEVQK